MPLQAPGKLITITLNNGMRVVLSPTREVGLVSLFLHVAVGSSYEEQYLGSGISHFLEHAIFLGSKRYPSCDEFSTLIESYGGMDFNAYTVNDHTAYYFTVFSKYLNPTLVAFRDFIENPLFENSLVEDERGTVLSEMDMYDDKVNDWYYNFIRQQLYQKNANKFPVIGLRSQFKKITSADLRAFHKKHYVPSKMVLSMVGNFEVDQVVSQMKETFGGFGDLGSSEVPTKRVPAQTYIPVKPEPLLTKDRYSETTHPRAEFSSVTMVWTTLLLKDKNKAEDYGLDVLAYLLASHKGSILYDDLKEKKQLVESVSAYSKVSADNGFFKIKFNLSNKLPKLVGDSLAPLTLSSVKKWVTLVEERMYELFLQIDKLIDEPMLEGVKNTFLKHHLDEQENYLDMAMSLAESLVELGHVHENENFIKGISKITLTDIQKLVKKYFSPVRPKHQIFLLPPSLYQEGKYNPTTIKSKDFNSELLKDLKNKKYQVAKCKSVSPSLDNTDLTLASKVSLEKKTVVLPVKRAKTKTYSLLVCDKVGGKLAKRTLLHHLNTKFPKLFLMLRFEGGALYEDYSGGLMPGSYHLLTEMLFTSNSRFSNLELAQFLKQHGISYHSFCGESSIGVSFSFLSHKFPEVMEVLKAITSETSFSEVDFERERKELLYQMEKSRENLDYVASLHFKKGFFKNTRLARPIYGDSTTVKKITRGSLEGLKQVMFSSRCVASLYGDYTANYKKTFTKWLATLGLSEKTKKKKDNPRTEKYSPIKLVPFSNRNVIHYEKNIKQSVFHLAYRAAPFGHKDVPVLEVLNSYFSGFGGPFFKLRSMSFEKEGKKLGGRAYRIGSSYRVAVDYGLFVFIVNFREEAEGEYRWAKKSFIDILNNLKVNPIPKVELERAKETLLSEKLMDSIRLQNRAHQENAFEYLGVGHNSFSKYEESWGRVSGADLIRVTKKYFKSEYFSHILLPKHKTK